MVSKKVEEDIEKPNMQGVSVDVTAFICVALWDLCCSSNTDLEISVFIVMHIAVHIMVQTQGTISFFVQLKHPVNPNELYRHWDFRLGYLSVKGTEK